MEVALIKRESTGSGPNLYNESETLTKFEIMDGAPVRGMLTSVMRESFDDSKRKFSFFSPIFSLHFSSRHSLMFAKVSQSL